MVDRPLGDDDSTFDCDDCGCNNLPKYFPNWDDDDEYDVLRQSRNTLMRYAILRGKSRTLDAIALYYARVLIKRGSPEGYVRLGELYWEGAAYIPRNELKAATVWLEADRLNISTYDTYMTGLSVAYM